MQQIEEIPVASAARERILAAARKVFLDGPPEHATMDALAQEAGMSKKTIYREFKSQLELLAALARENASEWVEPPLPGPRDDIELELYGLLVRLVTMITSPRNMALFRLIISEVRRYPELLQKPRPKDLPRQAIVRFLSAPAVRAKYTIDDPEDAAAMLMGMVMQDGAFRLLLSADAQPTPLHVIEQRARTAVSIYLKGVAK